jgi:hypothetical protein
MTVTKLELRLTPSNNFELLLLISSSNYDCVHLYLNIKISIFHHDQSSSQLHTYLLIYSYIQEQPFNEGKLLLSLRFKSSVHAQEYKFRQITSNNIV